MYIVQAFELFCQSVVCVMLAGPIADPLPNWVTDLSNVSAEQRWVLLTNLKASASYQFRVSAVNSVGEGSPSKSSNAVALPQEGMTKILLDFYFSLICLHYVLRFYGLLQPPLALQEGLLGQQGHLPRSSLSGSPHWKSTGMGRSWVMLYVTVCMDTSRVPGQPEILQMRCSSSS